MRGMVAYKRIPLFIKIIISLLIGAVLGHAWHSGFGPLVSLTEATGINGESFKWIADLILRVLRLLATPLIFTAVIGSIIGANITGRKAGKLMWLLMSNTVIAILVGLLVANVVRPGDHLRNVFTEKGPAPEKEPYNIWNHLLDSIPTDFISPFQKNDIIGIIIIAIAFGVAMRMLLHSEQPALKSTIEHFQKTLNAFFQLTSKILHWVFELVPLAVFAVVTRVVATKGLESLTGMGVWVLSVVGALLIMGVFYLIRMSLSSRISPLVFLKGGKDAFFMAFSTASSAATLPVTYRCATDNLKIKDENASMGIMVGGTFNHDGTALYEAMAALFIAQGIGMHLPVGQQVIVVIMSVIASVGAAGIPEAGLVTMLAVFKAVNLPVEYIPLLLTVDWFLDRCRTTINVMGDMASTAILEGREAPTERLPRETT
jgi:Na+/H+-dicarboxylate symporter